MAHWRSREASTTRGRGGVAVAPTLKIVEEPNHALLLGLTTPKLVEVTEEWQGRIPVLKQELF